MLQTQNLPPSVQSHLEHKIKRHERFSKGIYGVVQEPVLLSGVIGLWEPPSYLTSRTTVRFRKTFSPSMLDWRCFYSGVICDYKTPRVSCNHDSRVMPWMGTRDHLVPLRKGLYERVDLGKLPTSLVWTSNVVNQTIGLAPLPVRLKIREWLSTTAFDRNNRSVEAGQNLRWIVIDMLNEFRIKGRFPWSRNSHGKFWYPEISSPLMQKWYQMEIDFLSLKDDDRDQYIKSFVWNF